MLVFNCGSAVGLNELVLIGSWNSSLVVELVWNAKYLNLALLNSYGSILGIGIGIWSKN